jgi:2-haloacid dehalogenase
MPIDAVVFDLGGVLIDWDPRRLYRKLLADEAAVEEFLATVCTPEWNAEQDRGRPFAEGVAELVERHPAHAAAIAAYHERWTEMLGGEVPGTVAVLAELRAARVPLYALSNWSAETFRLTRGRFPFLEWFDGLVVSGEEKVAKPDRRIFELLLERFGLVPASTLFVDDSPANVAAARDLGLDAVLFRDADALRRELAARGLLDGREEPEVACPPGLYTGGMDGTDHGVGAGLSSAGQASGPAATPALDLGARLRAERLRQGISLREMARRVGVSASALSQIETGKAQPSVSKLFDIVNLLDTSLDGLLAGDAGKAPGDRVPAPDGHGGAVDHGYETEGFFSFQRSGEHEVLELESGVHWRRLTAGSLPGIEFLHVSYAPGARSSRDGAYMRHAGQEFGYVLSGRLVVDVGFDSYQLGPGDSISFPAPTPHRLSNQGTEPATAVWCVLGRHSH